MNKPVTSITRLFRYQGSKWRFAPHIAALIAKIPHWGYVEPFGGSAAVLLTKSLSEMEAYNDLDKQVLNFFEVLRETPDALARAIQLTPVHEGEYKKLAKTSVDTSATHLERARQFWIRSSFGITPKKGASFEVTRDTGQQSNEKQGGNKLLSVYRSFDDYRANLYATAERLRRVRFHCRHAAEVIAIYNQCSTLLYVDPPYLNTDQRSYVSNMGIAEHQTLLDQLTTFNGFVLLSSYANDIYDTFLKANGWCVIQFKTNERFQGFKGQSFTPKTDQLWINPSAYAAINAKASPEQQKLF